MGIETLKRQLISVEQKYEAQGNDLRNKDALIKQLTKDVDDLKKRVKPLNLIFLTFKVFGVTLLIIGTILDPLVTKIFWRTLHTTQGVGYLQWFLLIIPGAILAYVGLRGGRK